MARKKKTAGRKGAPQIRKDQQIIADLLKARGKVAGDADALRLAGHLLCGTMWQAEVVRLLDVNHRFVTRVLAGEARLRDEHFRALHAAIRDRAAQIERNVKRLPEQAAA